MTDRIADPWGVRTPYGPREAGGIGQVSGEPAWPVRVDMFLEPGLSEEDVERWVRSASLLHSNGDAMEIAVRGGRIVGVRGRATDRVNHGRLDPKDLYGWQANNHPDRLRRPLVRDGDDLVETDWETAMGRIVARSRELLAGPGGWGHFGRVPQLADAAPQGWVEVDPADADRLSVAEGDLVRVESSRGVLVARARVCPGRPGTIFVPFHYGYWDTPAGRGRGYERAANELTLTAWDPVSKQPIFKISAVRLVKVADADGNTAPAPTVGAAAPADGAVPATTGGPSAQVAATVEGRD
ncbi:molybdopterin dinucleotide binding domain-containing protein [Plantactinospora sp. DSM 117369]